MLSLQIQSVDSTDSLPDSGTGLVQFVPPKGIHVDQEASVLDGWTKHYEEPYNTVLSADGEELVPPSDAEWVAFGAKDSDGKVILVAYGNPEEVFKSTNNNETTHHNDVYFYRCSGKSCGFAPNDNISLGNADTQDRESNERLSLHLGQSCGGWRAGSRTSLDSSQEVFKFVYYRSSGVADPASKPKKSMLRVLAFVRKLVLLLGPGVSDEIKKSV